jgi:hypothetical protein
MTSAVADTGRHETTAADVIRSPQSADAGLRELDAAELTAERRAMRDAVTRLRLVPVMFEQSRSAAPV